MDLVRVSAPATIANLVCGFDILGLCLEQPEDIMEMRLNQKGKITIRHTDAYDLPTEPAKNVAGAALLAMQQE